jgi:hypothetical protein
VQVRRQLQEGLDLAVRELGGGEELPDPAAVAEAVEAALLREHGGPARSD